MTLFKQKQMNRFQKNVKFCIKSFFIAATVIAIGNAASAEPFPPGCKNGGYQQPKQTCDVSYGKARLNGRTGEIVTYRLSSGYIVKRFIAADFSYEMAKYGSWGDLTDWTPVSWIVSNPNTSECSLVYKDSQPGANYPILTTFCGE